MPFIYAFFIRPRGHKAFSLIEAAIVLAIIALVLGGLWAAASSVSTAMKIENTQKGWLYYSDLIGTHFTSNDAEIYGANRDIEDFLITFPLPEGWTIIAGHPRDPFGHALYAQILPAGYGMPATFMMGYPWQTIDSALCVRMTQILNNVSRIYTAAYGNAACNSIGGNFTLRVN